MRSTGCAAVPVSRAAGRAAPRSPAERPGRRGEAGAAGPEGCRVAPPTGDSPAAEGSEGGTMRETLIAAAVLIAGGVTETAATPSQEADRWALENAREIGEPEDCLQLNRIRSTKVRSGDVIDFEMIDGRIMRSRLPHRCPGLSFEERF